MQVVLKISKTMGFNTVETKWNADEQKLRMLMEIEAELEDAFLNKDATKIWDYMGSYRRHAITKFTAGTQKVLNADYELLSKKLEKFLEDKSEKTFNDFYAFAEGLFIKISQNIKEAGIYYREGKSASHAILQR